MDKHAYIPPQVEKAMAQHMAQSMPAQMKQFAQAGQAHIPQHMETAMAKQMEQSLPEHLKQYVDPFMEQKVVFPNVTRPSVDQGSPPHFSPHNRSSHLQRQGQDLFQATEQATEYEKPPQAQSATPDPTQSQADVSSSSSYDFIVNPEQLPSKRSLPGGNSMAMRALFAAGGLLILLVAFVIIKDLISGSSKLGLFVTVAQDQQELIHLATNATQQQDLSTSNQNFVATAQLSLSSSQSQIVSYLANNNMKVNPKTLSLKLNSSLDNQLTTAETAGTFNQTFQDTMKSQLDNYVGDLKQTYDQTSGKKGHALLSSEYNQAQLLLSQVSASTSSTN